MISCRCWRRRTSQKGYDEEVCCTGMHLVDSRVGYRAGRVRWGRQQLSDSRGSGKDSMGGNSEVGRGHELGLDGKERPEQFQEQSRVG
jgi:hypothetical protein